MPAQGRTLSPLSLFDVEAVRALAARENVREAELRAVWRTVVREGAAEPRAGHGATEHCVQVLRGACAVTTSSVVEACPASRGFKLVVALQDEQLVETVAIVHEASVGGGLQGRITVCVSSQVGCKMACTFCATGTMGFKANLTAGEICEQILHVERHAPTIGCHWRVTNVVMMGMGEPLNNYREVVSALQTMRDVWELAPSRLTVSTVGVVNRMRQLAHDAPGVSLALSLHAATQETRVKLVPSSSAFTVEKLMAAVDDYTAISGRAVMIEYILIREVNDSVEEAATLRQLLLGKNVVINLIPYNNTTAGDKHGYCSPEVERVRAFASVVAGTASTPAGSAPAAAPASPDSLGAAASDPLGDKVEQVGDGTQLRVSVRWSSAYARDVAGACGQLALVTSAAKAEESQRPDEAPEEAEQKHDGGCAADIEDLVISERWASKAFARVASLWKTAVDIEDDTRTSPDAVLEEPRTPLQRCLLEDGVPPEMLPLYTTAAFTPVAGEESLLLAALATPLASSLGVDQLDDVRARAPESVLERPAHVMPAMQHAMLCSGFPLSASEKRAGTNAWFASAEHKALQSAYEAFVRRVVLPRVDAHTRCGRIVYQASPTIRISLPGGKAPGGRPRASVEHFHQVGELAFWVPLTRCRGSEAMHVASEPGVDAEVTPLELELGECASWCAHRLRSGFVGNNTTDSATVGLDFHVIPWPLYREAREAARKSSHNLRLGGYYAVMVAQEGEAVD